MQLKRVLVSLLVAVMLISMAAFAASAADTADGTFAIAVDGSDSEGYLPVTVGDVLEVEIVITNNPGVSVASFAVGYDTAALKYTSYQFGEIYGENAVGSEKYSVVPGTDDKLHVFTNMMADDDVTETGVLVTLQFEVIKGEKAQVYIENVKANNSNGVRIEGSVVTIACGHENVTVLEAVAPTCTETGLTEGQQCVDCEEILTAQEEIPALGHTEEVLVAVEATCTETGLTEGKKCSVCGEITVAQETVAAKGHTEEIIPAVDATCTATGLTEGKKCSVCGVVTVEQTATDKVAHTEVVIEAVAASCTAAGSTEGKKCSVCGAITVAPEEVQPTGHTLEEIPAVEPTYSEVGATAGSKCIVCNEIIDAPEEIPAKSLAWLWILIACVVVVGGGAAAFYFLYWKKRPAK